MPRWRASSSAIPNSVEIRRPNLRAPNDREHLMAIALQTARAKDHARLVMFVEAGVADTERLRQILARHSLLEKWAKFEQRFLQP